MHPSRNNKVAVILAGLAAVGMAGCGGPAPTDPQGEWSGTLQTETGRCPSERPSRFLVDNKHIAFVPGGGVLVLDGTRDPNTNRFHAQLQLTDMNHKPLPMVFEGTLSADGSTIHGTYGTPACRAHITLSRPQDRPFQRALGN